MKNELLFLTHIYSSILKIEEYICEGREVFLNSTLIQDAVYRNFEIIGEAASRCSIETRLQFPDLPWSSIVGLRNVIIHQYDGVNPIEIWNTTQNSLPKLKITLAQYLEKSP